jgi:hypothetical protein
MDVKSPKLINISKILEFLDIRTLLSNLNVNKQLRKTIKEKFLNDDITKIIRYMEPLLQDQDTFRRFMYRNDKFKKEILRQYPNTSLEMIEKGLSYTLQMILEQNSSLEIKEKIDVLENHTDQPIISFYNSLPGKYKNLFRFVINNSSLINTNYIQYLKNFYRIKISNFTSLDKFTSFVINEISRNDILLRDLEIAENMDSNLNLTDFFSFLNKQKNYLHNFSISLHNKQDINVENLINIIEANIDSLSDLKLDVKNLNGIYRVFEVLSKCFTLKKIKFSHSSYNEKTFEMESFIVDKLCEIPNLKEITLNLEYPENIARISKKRNTNFTLLSLPQIYPKEIYSFYSHNFNLRKLSIKTVDLLNLNDMIEPLFESIKLKLNLKSVHLVINQMDEHFDIYKKLIVSLYETRINKLVINPINKTIKKKLICEVITLLRKNESLKKIRFKKAEYNFFLGNICKFSVSRIIEEMLEVMSILYERNGINNCGLWIKYNMDVDYEKCIFKYSSTWKNYPLIMRLVEGIEILGIGEENILDFCEFLKECVNLKNFCFFSEITEKFLNQFIPVVRCLEKIEKIQFNYNGDCSELLGELISVTSKKNLHCLDISHNFFNENMEHYFLNYPFTCLKILKISNLYETLDKDRLTLFLRKLFNLNNQLYNIIINGEKFEKEDS